METYDTAAWRYRASPGDQSGYLGVALLISVVIHAALLSIHFASPPAASAVRNTLEITLVNSRTEAKSDQPQVLAQHQIDGGGTADHGVSASPLPRTSDQTANDVVLAALRKRQHELEQQQQSLLVQLDARQHVQAASPSPDLLTDPGESGHDELTEESLVLSAQISALKKRIEHYNARPRQQFVGPSAQAVEYAEYVEAWRQSIELLGTQHYPSQARGKVYGKLQLTVYIKSNGELDRIEIEQPSSHAVLNLAAQRIVQLAAPFPPLPAALASETDILAITRTWHFTNQQLTTEFP